MKKILIISDYDVDAVCGSAIHIRNFMNYLHQFYEVEHMGALGAEGCEDQDAEHVKNMLEDFKPDVVIADYAVMAAFFSLVPEGVRKVIFTHDMRMRIKLSFLSMGIDVWPDASWEKEADLIRKADVVLTLNNEDNAMCLAMGAKKTIPVRIALDCIPRNPAHEISGRCIYVARAAPENIWCVNWLKEKVWPLVTAKIGLASLDVVMSNRNYLQESYAQAQLALIPHRLDGGLKLKFVEAMQHGLPVVGNPSAIDGFPEADETAAMVETEPEKFAFAIVHILSSPLLRKFMGGNAHELVGRRMTPTAAYGEFVEWLG